EVCNIYRMHQGVTAPDALRAIEVGCRSASLGCGDCKKQLAARLSETLGPMRERAQALRARPDDVHDVLRDGAKRAREIAAATMDEVRARMGLRERAAPRPGAAGAR